MEYEKCTCFAILQVKVNMKKAVGCWKHSLQVVWMQYPFIMNHDAWLFFSKNQANWQSVIETMKCTEETCKVIDFKSLNTYQNSLICL